MLQKNLIPTDDQNNLDRLEQLRGQLDRITFHNEENGYTVAKLKVYGRRELVTVVGNIADPTPGEILLLSGEWTSHPKFGVQFKIVFYKSVVPATATGIEKYLGSGLIKGIGPAMAKRMVKIFGEHTLDIIENEPNRLKEVPGIAEGRIEMIAKAWSEQKAVRDVMIFLQGHGVSCTYATRIYREYGDDAIRIVSKNPYRLARDIYGIGFLTADKIAATLGYDKESTERAQAGILHTLNTASDEGHVCLPLKELLSRSKAILEVDEAIIREAMGVLSLSKDIILDKAAKEIADEIFVYLAKFHLSERKVAEMLCRLSSIKRTLRAIDGEKAVEWVEGKLSLTLAENQKKAVRNSIMHKVSVITGGPGTGKTTIIKAILRIFAPLTKKILLAAPTGRAAKRMSEATGFPAKTIHRLLEYNMQQRGFMKNADDPLSADLVIIDEVSMLDLILTYHLLKAIPDGAMLILVGDADQLPAVGAGSVLKDIIASGVISVVHLSEIFRQARTSAIITNAHKVINGIMPDLHRNDTDFIFYKEEEPAEAVQKIVALVKKEIPLKYPFTSQDIQVLSPMNRGSIGAHTLNEELQDALNPFSLELLRGGRKFRVGDKIMQLRNNYDKNVYNGDMGIITNIDGVEKCIYADIDGNIISYDFAELDEITLAYAVSIHKSQGSEYPVVVIPITTQHYIMLQRNLLYTAMTRGKKLVVLVGTAKAIAIAVKNEKVLQRYGRLKERLRENAFIKNVSD